MPEIKFDPKLEKLISEKREEIEQKILSCKYPLSVEDFAALVWEHMQQKYPAETENINSLEAVHALEHEVLKLISRDKLLQHDSVPTHDGRWIPRLKSKT